LCFLAIPTAESGPRGAGSGDSLIFGGRARFSCSCWFFRTRTTDEAESVSRKIWRRYFKDHPGVEMPDGFDTGFTG
jgi:hypothetical protein